MKNIIKFSTILFSLILFSIIVNAQESQSITFPPPDPDGNVIENYTAPTEDYLYVPGPPNGATAPNAQSVVATDLTDIFIDNHQGSFDYQKAEPTISIDKHNPMNVVISACTLDDYSKSQGYYFTTDGFQTIPLPLANQSDVFPTSGSTHQAGFDPSLAHDQNGKIYMSSLNAGFSNNSFILDASTDHASTWSFVTTSPTLTSMEQDKEWITADNLPGSPYENYLYGVWVDVANSAATGNYGVYFAKKCPTCTAFSTPIAVKTPVKALGPRVATGPNGEIYICWYEYEWCPAGNTNCTTVLDFAMLRLVFAVSINGGTTFTKVEVSTEVESISDGSPTPNTGLPGFGNTRMIEMPSMAVDRSCGGPFSFPGRIYIAAPRGNGGTNCRIALFYSDDEGTTWSLATNPIGDITKVHNFQPEIAVDNASGVVCVGSLEIANAPTLENVVFSYSSDGGETFTNMIVNGLTHVRSSLYTPGGFLQFSGDYIGTDAYAGKAYVVWTNHPTGASNGIFHIYCSPVTFDAPLVYSSATDFDINGPVTIDNTHPSITYQASNAVNATANSSTFTVAATGNCTMRAGNHVKITQGFHASNGSVFHAYIDNFVACTNPWRIAGTDNQNTNEKDKDVLFSCSAYPNPFLHSFDIKYMVEYPGVVNIELIDMTGNKISNLVENKFQDKGVYKFNVKAASLAGGIYYCRLTTSAGSITNKIIKLN